MTDALNGRRVLIVEDESLVAMLLETTLEDMGCTPVGPAATVGEILEVKFPRPRSRKALLEDPEYYRLREELIGFLEERSHLRPAAPAPRPSASAPTPKPRLKRFLSALTAA